MGIGQVGILVVKKRRNIGPSAREPLKSPKQSRKYFIGVRRKLAKYKKTKWLDESLKLAIERIDEGYKMMAFV